MIVTYNTASPAAQIQLALLKSLSGEVIHAGLKWELQGKQTYTSNEAQPTLEALPGTYKIKATYEKQTHELGELELAQRTLTNVVFSLNVTGRFEEGGEYFSDYDAVQENERRQQERVDQSQFGISTTPLKDPYARDDQGNQFATHPLLQNAQFDGMENNVKPVPEDNTVAVQKSYDHQLANQNKPGTTPNPSSGM